jgi:nucleoside-diphosphate-sugar epimerase
VAAIVAQDHSELALRASEQPRTGGPRPASFADSHAMVGRSNFWTSVDSRDSAQAIEKGLLADYDGSHILFVNDRVNCASAESRRLVEVFFPEISRWQRPVAGHETLVSIAAARALLGYEPEYSLDAGPGY